MIAGSLAVGPSFRLLWDTTSWEKALSFLVSFLVLPSALFAPPPSVLGLEHHRWIGKVPPDFLLGGDKHQWEDSFVSTGSHLGPAQCGHHPEAAVSHVMLLLSLLSEGHLSTPPLVSLRSQKQILADRGLLSIRVSQGPCYL